MLGLTEVVCLRVCLSLYVSLVWRFYNLNGWADFDDISHKNLEEIGQFLFSQIWIPQLDDVMAAILQFSYTALSLS